MRRSFLAAVAIEATYRWAIVIFQRCYPGALPAVSIYWILFAPSTYATTLLWKGGMTVLPSLTLKRGRLKHKHPYLNIIAVGSTLWGSCLGVLTFQAEEGGGKLSLTINIKLQFHDKKCCQHGNDFFKHLLNHFTTNSNTWSVILTFHSDITSKAEEHASQTVLKSSIYYSVNTEWFNYSCLFTSNVTTNKFSNLMQSWMYYYCWEDQYLKSGNSY